jgi:hypothetical protein
VVVTFASADDVASPPDEFDVALRDGPRLSGVWRGPVKTLLSWLARARVRDVSVAPPDLEHLFLAYYDDEPGASPHFPAIGEGTVIDVPDVPNGSFLFPFPIANRSMYYFTLFVEDCAGNSSPGTVPTVRDSALSYYLGDWDSNLPPVCAGSPEYTSGSGTVDFCDEIGLSLTYGTSTGHPAFKPEADIGPTIPGPGPLEGVPATDGQIQFEDLILFAINFGDFTPLTGNVTVASDWMQGGDEFGAIGAITTPRDVRPHLELGHAMVDGRRLVMPLVLHGNQDTVKGFGSVIEWDGRALEFVGATTQPGFGDDVFFAAIPGRGSILIADLAVLGGDRVLEAPARWWHWNSRFSKTRP